MSKDDPIGGECAECGLTLRYTGFHLDSGVGVCMECYNGYSDVMKDHSMRLVCKIARLENALRQIADNGLGDTNAWGIAMNALEREAER
jgi:hypothetical protein